MAYVHAANIIVFLLFNLFTHYIELNLCTIFFLLANICNQPAQELFLLSQDHLAICGHGLFQSNIFLLSFNLINFAFFCQFDLVMFFYISMICPVRLFLENAVALLVITVQGYGPSMIRPISSYSTRLLKPIMCYIYIFNPIISIEYCVHAQRKCQECQQCQQCKPRNFNTIYDKFGCHGLYIIFAKQTVRNI